MYPELLKVQLKGKIVNLRRVLANVLLGNFKDVSLVTSGSWLWSSPNFSILSKTWGYLEPSTIPVVLEHLGQGN